MVGFAAVGVGITVVFDWIAMEVLDRWAYADAMPTRPLLGTGIPPVLQWMLFPPFIVWFVRRQLT